MTELPNVANFVARAAQQCGFERDKFVDSKLPESFDKIAVILFLGDYRGISILSMLLFKPFLETVLKDKYVILCSYPGMGGLFPGVNEYWSVTDGLALSDLMSHANGFKNTDKRMDAFGIQLRRHFLYVLTEEDFISFYDNGLTTTFFKRFKKVDRYLPAIPHRGDFNLKGGMPLFLFPSQRGKVWDRGKEVSIKLPRDFWIKLTERLLSHGFAPVVYQNQISHDISPHFGERCSYITDRNILGVLSAMRSTGCVLDLFSGISRLAVIARCPFLTIDERQRYVKSKEFEINDLCIGDMYPYRYVFSFPTVVENENFDVVIDHVVNVALQFIPKVLKLDLPPSSEQCDEVSYDVVRQHKAKKLGIRFIKVERLVIQ
jgi:hypothetical protein